MHYINIRDKIMTLTPQEELLKIRQEMLAKEVDAELKNDQIKAFWKKYRFLLIGLAVAAVAAAIAFEVYNAWWHKVRLSESDRFETAAVLAYQGESDAALNELVQLSQNGKTGYQYLSDLKQASILMGQGKTAEAFDILTRVMENADAPDELRSVARLSLAGHQIDTKPAGEIQSLLQPLLNETNAFFGLAAELAAINYLKQGDKTGAKNILNQALQAATVPLNIKQRLSELQSVIGE